MLDTYLVVTYEYVGGWHECYIRILVHTFIIFRKEIEHLSSRQLPEARLDNGDEENR